MESWTKATADLMSVTLKEKTVSVSCRVFPMDTHWFVYKIRFNSMNHVGQVLNDYFN